MSPNSEDLYGSGSQTPPDAGGAPADDQGGGSDESTSILPISFFPSGVKPGDSITVKVVAVHESDVEVMPDSSDEEASEDGSAVSDSEPPGAASGGAAPDPSSMSSMMG